MYQILITYSIDDSILEGFAEFNQLLLIKKLIKTVNSKESRLSKKFKFASTGIKKIHKSELKDCYSLYLNKSSTDNRTDYLHIIPAIFDCTGKQDYFEIHEERTIDQFIDYIKLFGEGGNENINITTENNIKIGQIKSNMQDMAYKRIQSILNSLIFKYKKKRHSVPVEIHSLQNNIQR